MAEIPVGIDPVAHELLELGGFRKTLCFRAREQELASESHLEHPTSAGHERNFAEIFRKRAQELLCNPRRAQEPTALIAIHDLDAWFGHGFRNIRDSGIAGVGCAHLRGVYDDPVTKCECCRDRGARAHHAKYNASCYA